MQKIIDIVHELPKHATKRWATRAAPVDCFCVHHSATRADVSIEAIARYHVVDKDMPSIQYHYVITAEGAIYQTQPDDLFVWHGNDWNTGLGVCLLGDFTTAHPPEAQLAAARWLLAEKRRQYGKLRLVGHKEAPRASTECPGRTWPEWKGKLEESMTKRWKIWPHFQGHVEKATASFTGSHEWKELVASPGMICTQINAFEYGKENPCPGTDWIERLWIGGDKVELAMMWQGAAGADIMWQKHVLPALVATSADGDPSHSWLRTVLWGNEPEAITNWDFVAPFNAYNVRAAEHMHSVGKEAWLGCISVGNPPIDYMQHLVPTTNAADVLLVHSYGAPTVLTEAEWYALRFQKWIGVLESLGEKVPRWFLGETGIDGGVLSNSNHPYRDEQLGWWKRGWRDWEEWNLQRGRPTYREQLSQLNEAIQDERIVGANTFIHIVMDSQWSSFDHNGEMTSWMAAQHRAMNMAVEEPVMAVNLEEIRNAGWNTLGVAYNPAAAFQAYAREHGLGAPLRDEHDVDGVRMQEFMGGIVYAPVGRWDETAHVSW